MKIAFIGGRDIRLIGGIENYMYNLATDLVTMGHEPIVYCESDRNDTEYVNGFKVIYRKSIGGRFLCKIILGLQSTIDALRNQTDVGYFHYNAWPPSLWSWIPRLYGRKTVLQGHGLEWKRTKYSPFQRKIMHVMEWFTAKLNHNVIVVSDEQREYFAKAYHRTCTTIPTAINLPDNNCTAVSDVLERYNLTINGYFLYLGRLVQDKNPDYLIRAYIQSGITGKKLVIAGSNDQQPDYVDMLHGIGKGCDRIIFTGAVYGTDKDTLLHNCFAFCIPSTIEGLSITLLEAMSHARLCIASDIEANREGLGENGIWVRVEDTDDLAAKLLYTSEYYNDIAYIEQLNYTRVKELFTWERITAKYVKYLESI